MARLPPQLWRRVTTTGGGATTLGFLCLRGLDHAVRPSERRPAAQKRLDLEDTLCAPCLWPLGFLPGFVAKRNFKRKLSLSVPGWSHTCEGGVPPCWHFIQPVNEPDDKWISAMKDGSGGRFSQAALQSCPRLGQIAQSFCGRM